MSRAKSNLSVNERPFITKSEAMSICGCSEQVFDEHMLEWLDRYALSKQILFDKEQVIRIYRWRALIGKGRPVKMSK